MQRYTALGLNLPCGDPWYAMKRSFSSSFDEMARCCVNTSLGIIYSYHMNRALYQENVRISMLIAIHYAIVRY
jgi:hypothetical protein